MRLMIICLSACTLSSALAEEPKKSELKPQDVVNKILAEKYPPLDGRLEMSIEDLGPLVIVNDPEEKKDVGSKTTFEVVLKNVDKKEFPYVPAKISIHVLDGNGKKLSHKVIFWNSSAHGDSGTYPIQGGETKSRTILLAIGDLDVKLGSKYTIIASYVELYEYEGVRTRYDVMMTAVQVEAVREPAAPIVKSKRSIEASVPRGARILPTPSDYPKGAIRYLVGQAEFVVYPDGRRWSRRGNEWDVVD